MEQKELDGKVWEVSGFVFENEDQAKLAKRKWKESSTYMII